MTSPASRKGAWKGAILALSVAIIGAVVSEVELIVRGVRGSMPVSGAEFVRHGGNTTCFEFVLGPRKRLVIDAGSGIRAVPTLDEYVVLLTHYHWDHVMGLPLFPALHTPGAQIEICGADFQTRSVQSVLEQVFAAPLFPVGLDQARARLSFRSIDPAGLEVDRLRVDAIGLCHPQGSLAFRVRSERRVVVIATDHEIGDPAIDQQLVNFAAGADLLVLDAQWTPEELPARRGWGHSSWADAAELAARAGVSKLLLFHHDPGRDDDQLDRIERDARSLFAATQSAREGMTFRL
jgi:phosphoribosyl 1,2-cyclic phosphodiesterase